MCTARSEGSTGKKAAVEEVYMASMVQKAIGLQKKRRQEGRTHKLGMVETPIPQGRSDNTWHKVS
jgi:hypothetical protein